MEVYGGFLDFTKPLDYFDIDYVTAEMLWHIGKPYDIFTNPLQVSLPEFQVYILNGVNDEDGIGSLLWRFNKPDRDRRCYGIYASFFNIEKRIYCAITICWYDESSGYEMPTAILEIGQDKEPYILPININEDAAEFFHLMIYRCLESILQMYGSGFSMNL